MVQIKTGAYGVVTLIPERNEAQKLMALENAELPYFILREVAFLRWCAMARVPYVVPLRCVLISDRDVKVVLGLYDQCLYTFLHTEKSRTERLRVGLMTLERIATVFHVMHLHGFLYRDCKPSNMLLSKNRQEVVLTDFGGARMELPGGDSTTPWVMTKDVCTHLYMPPEMVANQAYGPPADIYLLGVSVIQIISGAVWDNKPLCRDTSTYETLKSTWRRFVNHVPQSVYFLVLNMIHLQPAMRPTAAAILKTLSKPSSLPELDITFLPFQGPTLPGVTAAKPEYWLEKPTPGFNAELRRDILKWIRETGEFLRFVGPMPEIAESVFDAAMEKVCSKISVTANIIQVIAITSLFLVTKFATANSPLPKLFLQMLQIPDATLNAANLLKWELRLFGYLWQ